ncbi:hypothetical protein [Streptomyces sp. NPDC018833]|uniref:hypothetical protein n=1 Tax=Streptomyces sp. NPDC018833 TaxID=3365053 RepID=UPI00378B704F
MSTNPTTYMNNTATTCMSIDTTTDIGTETCTVGSSDTAATRIDVRIGRLVLDHINAPSEVGVLRTALEAELAELLKRDPVVAHRDRRIPCAPAFVPDAPVDIGPAALGRHIARAIHSSLRAAEQGGPR